MSEKAQLVVGTAGHIDHGKSRLVQALSGVDPDRLPEEKARGMTIDLGFAHTPIDDCDIWFVDVPGHERFIRNMVAGASGVDVALLVVAADDSVMPQTREHAEVLSLLGIERVVVALTKMDLVDDDWAEAVEEEVRELLSGFHLTPLHFVRTSAESGRGLDDLRRVLAELARGRAAQSGPAYSWFRLPIDRVFSVPGRGTVVTGSVAHGALRAEDELELWPEGRRVRVRDLQTHHAGVAAVAGRMRLAANLAGVPLAEVARGCELATPGYLEPTRCADVLLSSFRMPGKTIRRRPRVRLHIATNETLAELRLIEKPAERGVRDVAAQLLTADAIVATHGQRFILRDESGVRTLGGGVVLRPISKPWSTRRPADEEGLRTLRDGVPKQRLEQAIRALQWNACGDAPLASRAGLADADVVTKLARQLGVEGRVRTLIDASPPVRVHAAHIEDLVEGISARLRGFLEENPRSAGVGRGAWPGWMPRACSDRVRAALAEHLIERGHFSVVDGHVVPKGHSGAMSGEDDKLYTALLDEYYEGAFQPPALASLRCRSAKNEPRLRELIRLALTRGALVRIAEGMWLHERRWDELTRLIADAALKNSEGLSVSEIRTLLDSSRKYVVPIVEQLDAAGVTRRVGDRRVPGVNAPH